MSGKMLLRGPAVDGKTGRKKSSRYKAIADGLLTPPIHWGGSAMWPSDEIDAIIAARIAGKSEDEIRALVRKLVAARKTAA